jgi:hypothetical protein
MVCVVCVVCVSGDSDSDVVRLISLLITSHHYLITISSLSHHYLIKKV